MIDLSTAMRAHNSDFNLRGGEFWYLTILEMLGAKIPRSDDAPSNTSDIEWVTL